MLTQYQGHFNSGGGGGVGGHLMVLLISTGTDTQTILEMYQAVIISVPSIIGLVSLVLLFGATAGYVIVLKKIMAQARSLKQSNLIGNESLDPNLDDK